MTTPSSPEAIYPYHPEAWQEICAVSRTAMERAVLLESTATSDNPIIAHKWLYNPYSFVCRVEQSADSVGEAVEPFTFHFQKVGNQRRWGQESYIEQGLPLPVGKNQLPYGILDYSESQGVLNEPRGSFVDTYIATIGRRNPEDPEERMLGIEDLLKTMFRYALREPTPPIQKPNWRRG